VRLNLLQALEAEEESMHICLSFGTRTLAAVAAISLLTTLAPLATAQEVEKLNKAIVSALRDKTVHDQITAVGVEAVTSTPAEFAQFVQSEMTKWGRVMQQAGLGQKQAS